MPKLNGCDAARHIRARRSGRGVVLVALTGRGQEDDRARTREAGFDGHLVKPPAALRAALAAFDTPGHPGERSVTGAG